MVNIYHNECDKTYTIEVELPVQTVKQVYLVGNWLDNWGKAVSLKKHKAHDNPGTHNRWKITVHRNLLGDDNQFKFLYTNSENEKMYAYDFDQDGNPIEEPFVNNNLSNAVKRTKKRRFFSLLSD